MAVIHPISMGRNRREYVVFVRFCYPNNPRTMNIPKQARNYSECIQDLTRCRQHVECCDSTARQHVKTNVISCRICHHSIYSVHMQRRKKNE